MNKYDQIVAEDFVAFSGTVIASYADFIRLLSTNGEPAGFKIGNRAMGLQVGTPITVIALQGSDKAAYVINHDTSSVQKIELLSGNISAGFQRFQSRLRFVVLMLLLVPFVGQFSAFAGGLGAIISGLVSAGVRGMPPVSVGRILLSLVVYFAGSLWFFIGWFSGEVLNRNIGFGILASGAVLYCFYAPRPGDQYFRALNDLVEKYRISGPNV